MSTFKAKHTAGSTYTIYGVQQLENGLTQFLIFHNGAQNWLWWPAIEFEPVEKVK